MLNFLLRRHVAFSNSWPVLECGAGTGLLPSELGTATGMSGPAGWRDVGGEPGGRAGAS